MNVAARQRARAAGSCLRGMVRAAVLVLSVALPAMPAFAAKKVSLNQLDQILTAAKGKPDLALSQQISDLELTERMSTAKLVYWTEMLPGEKTRAALLALKDKSVFLDPPAAELPARPAPDQAEQKRIMSLVVAYIAKTIPQLPNLIATRDTKFYEDTPQLQTVDELVPYEPLHPIGSREETVLYRDGREVVDAGPGKKPEATAGLATWGVFGPILSTVLLDAARSKLEWNRWEQDGKNLEAVFSFEVPQEKSHYEVNYCCVATQAGSVAANVSQFHKISGYHGTMAVDPATGAVLRLMVEAELKETDPVVRAGIVVEYAPVEIGGKQYICPVRSVSDTLAQSVQVDPKYHFALANQLQPLKISLNDVAFDHYHLFRGDAKVLTGNEAVGEAATPTSSGVEDANAAANAAPSKATSTTETGNASAAANVATTAPVPSPAPNADATGPPASATASPVTKTGAETPEISVTNGVEALDNNPPPAPASAPTGFTLRTTARLVDVGVVAFDKKGHPVTDLKASDFEVDDNGRKQEVRFFHQGGNAESEAAASPGPQSMPAEPASTLPPDEFSNRPENHAGSAAGREGDATVLLIDASNLAFGDLTYARGEMLRFLKTLPNDERAGLYVLKSHGFEILLEPTGDHVTVAAKLAHWMPSAQDLARAQAEEQRNRQQIEYVHSAADLAYVNGNAGMGLESFLSGGPAAEAATLASSVDPQLREMGSNPGRDALFLLASVARHLAAIPGHKSLIWVSSDNALADWTNQAAEKQERGSKFLDSLSLRAEEAMNEAHVSVYPLDASQLEAGGIGADIGTRNVLVVGKSDRDSKIAMGDATPGSKPGRDTARMQQDMHPIQGVYRDLADATGGRAFRRSGDIAAELNAAVADGRAAYLLSFSPDSPADDKYHNLTVKLTGRKDISLHYRAGYLYSKEPATIKDRLREAIWQAADSSDITLGATPEVGAGIAIIRLRIAASDLALDQQNGRWTDRLAIFLVQRDDEIRHAELSGQTLGLRLAEATYERAIKEGIPFEQKIELKPGTGAVRLIVLDEYSGRIGSVTLSSTALRR